MANNRLFMGHVPSKRWVFLSKGFGSGWRAPDEATIERMEELFNTPELIQESEVRGKTGLVFFTEYDDLYSEVFAPKSKWRPV